MRALIADDEPVARALLREHLEHFPAIEIVGEAASGDEVVAAVNRLDPDLLFLDINMPGLDGFAALRALQGAAEGPAVIFVTAHDDRALDAFNVGAADYLLKPIRSDRLARAIDKAAAASNRARPSAKKEPPPPPAAAEPPLRTIVGRLGSDLHILDPAEVVAFQAEGETVHIVSTRGRFTAGSTLRELEARLPAPRFRRIHRATIINTAHIRKISPLSSKRWLLKMSNGLEMIVSKRMTGMLRGEIGL